MLTLLSRLLTSCPRDSVDMCLMLCSLRCSKSIFSCVGSEMGAQSLATVVSRLEVRGHKVSFNMLAIVQLFVPWMFPNITAWSIARLQQYDLDVYGGVIATRAGTSTTFDRLLHGELLVFLHFLTISFSADRYDINTIHDLQDKVIGAGSTSDLMAGQLQFYEMQKTGKFNVAVVALIASFCFLVVLP